MAASGLLGGGTTEPSANEPELLLGVGCEQAGYGYSHGAGVLLLARTDANCLFVCWCLWWWSCGCCLQLIGNISTALIVVICYFNFLLFENYLRLIVWAILFSQALRQAKNNVVAVLQYLSDDPDVDKYVRRLPVIAWLVALCAIC